MEDFESRIRTRARQRVGAAVADHLGITAEGIDEIVGGGTCPDQIRDALCDAFERGEAIHQLAERQAAEEPEPGHCCNAVCRQWVGSEGEETDPETGVITFTGRQSYCEEGGAFAVGCLFRMKTSPPNHLDSVSCQTIPEWSEAIDMLRQNGLLDPDEYGRWNGTNFAFKTRRLWWAFVDLLVESGRIEESWIDDADMADRSEQSRLAKELLFPAPDRELQGRPRRQVPSSRVLGDD